jgi:hypothetical protein
MKRIFFTKPLVEKIKTGEARVTFRTRKHFGEYEVCVGNWRKPSSVKTTDIIINVYQSELVYIADLTDADVQEAGVPNKEFFLELMLKFYGKIPVTLWRNRFRIVKLP